MIRISVTNAGFKLVDAADRCGKIHRSRFPGRPVEPAIKSFLKAEHRMLIALADDEIGYIIPKAEWDEKAPYLNNAAKRWYGEVNSVGPEAASRIAAALQELLR
jgi:hypothetical protein